MAEQTKFLEQILGTDIFSKVVEQFDWFSEYDQQEVKHILNSLKMSKETQEDIYKSWSASIKESHDFYKKQGSETYTDINNVQYQIDYEVYMASDKGTIPNIDTSKLSIFMCDNMLRMRSWYEYETEKNIKAFNDIINNGFFWRQMFYNKNLYPAIIVQFRSINDTYIFNYYRLDNSNFLFVLCDVKPDQTITHNMFFSNNKIKHMNVYNTNYKNPKVVKIITKIYFDDDGKYHNEKGPSKIIYSNNGKIIEEYWYNHGIKHRTDGPAVTIYNMNGKQKLFEEYYINGKNYNGDKPAVISYHSNGVIDSEIWFDNNGKYKKNTDKPYAIFYTKNGIIKDKYWATSCINNDNYCLIYERFDKQGKLSFKQYMENNILYEQKIDTLTGKPMPPVLSRHLLVV